MSTGRACDFTTHTCLSSHGIVSMSPTPQPAPCRGPRRSESSARSLSTRLRTFSVLLPRVGKSRSSGRRVRPSTRSSRSTRPSRRHCSFGPHTPCSSWPRLSSFRVRLRSPRQCHPRYLRSSILDWGLVVYERRREADTQHNTQHTQHIHKTHKQQHNIHHTTHNTHKSNTHNRSGVEREGGGGRIDEEDSQKYFVLDGGRESNAY
jgi:hypothetical protein